MSERRRRPLAQPGRGRPAWDEVWGSALPDEAEMNTPACPASNMAMDFRAR
ncbi:hypothetical protein ABZT02_35230 [Streptomyces sp. NPDC005402]|uniref:hypothetical protein n=1 Tax=Streptomyces sp. NPDC005402 TaxID=3155338 RepID=UPI0033AF659A